MRGEGASSETAGAIVGGNVDSLGGSRLADGIVDQFRGKGDK
jgi:hypothetical protein